MRRLLMLSSEFYASGIGLAETPSCTQQTSHIHEYGWTVSYADD